ncbi:MAG: dipeptidase, partial [Candidatus Scatosoma sp.]
VGGADLFSALHSVSLFSGEVQTERAAWKKAECALQCFAVFCGGESEEDEQSVAAQLALFSAVQRDFENGAPPEHIALRRAALTVEGGGATGGNLGKAAALFKAGVKIFSPVWNVSNSLCDSCGNAGGLTERGKDVIALALESGVLPDISHASDSGAQDTFALAKQRKKAVVATHSLVRALCDTPRNLTDGQIKAIADSGGVAGVCFVRKFAGAYPLTEHIKYLVSAGGEDCVAFGGDFFGCDDMLIKSVSEMPAFFRALEKRFTPRQIEKFAFKNAFRLFGY